MGKCSQCKKKIEYNNYQVIDGLVYCPNCTPKKKEVVEKLAEVVQQRKLQFTELENAMDEAQEKLVDTIANDPDIEDELKEEKKPRKKRSRK